MFLLFPLGPEEGSQRAPWVTWSLIGLCVVTFGLTHFERRNADPLRSRLDESEEMRWGVDSDGVVDDALRSRLEAALDASGGWERRLSLVPRRGLAQIGWVTSLFVHFGWLHLLGNMLFLFVLGPLLEEAWGRWRFGLFYLCAGLAAGATQYALRPGDAAAIGGASGAIAGSMGAFAIRFASVRIRLAYFFWFIIRPVWGTFGAPAWLTGLASFLREALDMAVGGAEGVATGAHVGGFVMGSAVALGMKALGWERAFQTQAETSAELCTAQQMLGDQQPAATSAETLAVELISANSKGLTVRVSGQERLIVLTAIERVDATQTGQDVTSLEVNLVLRGTLTRVLQLSGADPSVPARFPTLSVEHAWAQLLTSLRQAIGQTLPSKPW